MQLVINCTGKKYLLDICNVHTCL